MNILAFGDWTRGLGSIISFVQQAGTLFTAGATTIYSAGTANFEWLSFGKWGNNANTVEKITGAQSHQSNIIYRGAVVADIGDAANSAELLAKRPELGYLAGQGEAGTQTLDDIIEYGKDGGPGWWQRNVSWSDDRLERYEVAMSKMSLQGSAMGSVNPSAAPGGGFAPTPLMPINMGSAQDRGNALSQLRTSSNGTANPGTSMASSAVTQATAVAEAAPPAPTPAAPVQRTASVDSSVASL